MTKGLSSSRLSVLFCLLLGALLIAGCGTKQTTSERPDTSWRMSDDGAPPLTRTELAVLQSTGEIDRALPPDIMADVAREYKYYLRKGRRTTKVFSKRAEQYLAFARQVFRSRDMPEDLAYLAIVESGYRTDARSHAGAAGAWQFMPATGKQYGLEQDWWQDERLDAYEATEAAADYLKKLYDMFEDWPTAIAAYNAGEGKMQRAMQSSGSKNFYEVRARNHRLDEKTRLREETTQYVPRFLAVTKIMRNLPALGFASISPEEAQPMVRLTARPGTDLQAVAKASGLSEEEFDRYNQHHKQVITCTSRTTHIYLPKYAAKPGKEYLYSAHAKSYAGWHAARVTTSSDSWDKISRRSNIPVGQLKAMNPGKKKLKAGHVVLVPRTVSMSPAAVAEASKRHQNSKQKTVSQVSGSHTLKANETLSAVARRYGVTLKALQAHNGIDDANKVQAGMVLRIPRTGKGTPQVTAHQRTVVEGRKNSRLAGNTYKVQQRDSLWNIARKHNVSVEDLKRWNDVDEKNLRPGAILVVGMR